MARALFLYRSRDLFGLFLVGGKSLDIIVLKAFLLKLFNGGKLFLKIVYGFRIDKTRQAHF